MPGQLFDQYGKRKYLTTNERNAFIKAAESAPQDVYTFCSVLAFTGCRLSEALELTVDRVDMTGRLIIFECLKKRRKGIFRGVPVPPLLLDTLDAIHNIGHHQQQPSGGRHIHLWPMSRPTAWRQVKAVMEKAGITCGPQASPKGLRHGFGVSAVSAGIPLNMVQKWLGHAQLSTTAIYAAAVGEEEHLIASRMW
ncbi:MAG: tyrosine-type recombinase/integrase [Proteobacteria bacterium]|nr:tyrosine-type recombinase/integrase [Pseudomonadota bacterium]